jgi:hypothetical protein
MPGIEADAATASTARPSESSSSRPSTRSKRNQMQRDRRVDEILELDVAAEEPTQTTGLAPGGHVVRIHHPQGRSSSPGRCPRAEGRARSGRAGARSWHLRARGHTRRVERPGRGSDQKVRRDPLLVQGLKHPDLHRRKACAARENERCARARSASFREAPRLMQCGGLHRCTTLRVGSHLRQLVRECEIRFRKGANAAHKPGIRLCCALLAGRAPRDTTRMPAARQTGPQRSRLDMRPGLRRAPRATAHRRAAGEVTRNRPLSFGR